MLISIITINYNNLEGLKRTMDSVFGQSYEPIEYLVIDGGSTDGSKAHIETHQNDLSYWVSESDGGIYDAMNKGIGQATGDYLLFLNSGDWLADDQVIANFVALEPIEDLLYGDPLVRDGQSWKRKMMPKQMNKVDALTHTLAHQAEFYKRSLFEDGFRYNTAYKVVADWVLTNDIIIFKNATTRYIDLVVCNFEDPGISSDFDLRLEERRQYYSNNFDPLFLELLHEYKAIRKELRNLKNNRLVKIALRLKNIIR